MSLNCGLTPAKKLEFSKDQLVKNYLWAMGIAWVPKFSKYRKWLTKPISILMVIDDIYDVYGSVDELELFKEAVKRWFPCLQLIYKKDGPTFMDKKIGRYRFVSADTNRYRPVPVRYLIEISDWQNIGKISADIGRDFQNLGISDISADIFKISAEML
ncbi:trans-ocimene synthase [Cinnamomum micranthum f. kanehirae]|uniref:Trans-ocimene synthase n=1 Tax=Cinnamomum micranthum f. kanehirae TaxID=337451 RepID=A0A443PC37_9MAGN|nr:trans-ocimene synthase [Cinnamomum micranthum f. kanehirae]